MFDYLKEQFKNKTITKLYTGLVEGVLEDDAGVINFPISRSKTFRGRMAARPVGQEGKEAQTDFTVLERFPHMTLVELQPVTGRMHQLRVHMKAFGHPLVGDTLYGRREQGKSIEQPLDRIFLQSTTLAFNDTNGEQKLYTLPLDKKLLNFLNALK
jgi:23S rRNA-/tRNA-specific pseudouridylate synthase